MDWKNILYELSITFLFVRTTFCGLHYFDGCLQ